MTIRFVRASLVAGAIGAFACGPAPRTPTAAPTPAPTATPAPAATPQAFSCPLPAMKDLHDECPKIDSKLLNYVNVAIDNILQKQPQLFDFNDARGDSVRVLDHHAYQTAVVAAINAEGGVCAADNNEEIQVKINNDFNEQFNIWTSSGYTRRSYISTCFPAQF
jgi:hypothetical protein